MINEQRDNRLQVINIVDELIHAITRHHIPDYPEAVKALQSLLQLIEEETNSEIFNFCREVIGADDDLLPNEMPDENGQVLATWATHRNQLRFEQRERLNRKLG